MEMIIGRSLTPLNSSRTMGSVRRRDDNSRGKVQNVRGDSSAWPGGDDNAHSDCDPDDARPNDSFQHQGDVIERRENIPPQGQVLGIDVGFSDRLKTTCFCALSWTSTSARLQLNSRPRLLVIARVRRLSWP